MKERMVEFWQRWRIEVVLAGVILLVALVPRVLDLGIFLTADEKNWIERSHAYVTAFADGRFNDMLQTTHPGVTVLWVTGIVIWIQQIISGIPYDGSLLIHFIKISQLPIAILNALWVVGLFGLLRVIMEYVGRGVSGWWRRAVPMLVGLVVALDPFVVGYSRVVHVDALLTGLVAAAGLATVIYGLSGWSRSWLRWSAVLSALALLTKIPAVFLIPWWGLVVVVFGSSSVRSGEWWKNRSRDFMTWLGIVVLVIVVLWPALLFVPDPKGNALLVKRDVSIAAGTPHHMTEDYQLDGGHYVFTLLTRTTPLTLLLVLVAVVLFGREVGRRRRRSGDEGVSSDMMRVVGLLVAYVFFFVVMMTLGAKKGDRYILPVWPMLDMLAVLGVVGLMWAGSNLLAAWRPRTVFLLVGGGMVAYMGVVTGLYHPYALAYSNPLFPSNLSQRLGWGEGLAQAAQWIEEKDSAAVIASWYPEELAAFARKARVLHISGHERPRVRYVVLYRNMLGRADDHPATTLVKDYLGQREPVHVIEIAGREYVWIFQKPAYERVVGELKPGRDVGQALPVEYDGAAAVDVMLATYRGAADSGELVVRLYKERGGEELTRWRRSVADLGDNEWLTLGLPEGVALERGAVPFVEISVQGNTGERAPTVLYTRDYADSTQPMVLDGEERAGNLGVRWRYQVADKLLTDQDVKVLD